MTDVSLIEPSSSFRFGAQEGESKVNAVVPTGWVECDLGMAIDEMTDFVASGSFESLRNNVTTYDRPNYAIYVRLFDLRLGLGHLTQKYVDRQSYDYLAKSNLHGGEILIANIGANVGEVFLMPSIGAPATIAPNMIVVRADKRKARNDFLYYFLSSDFGQKRICEQIAGSGQPKLNKTDLKKTVVLLPTIGEQEHIAQVLSDTDGLIVALEALIAKKRVVKQGAMQELLMGKRRLPGFSESWERKRIGQLLTIMHGKDQRSVEDENGQFPVLATGGQIGRAREYLYDRPSVLIGRKGTIDRPQYMDTPFWTVDTLFYSIIKQPNDAKFLYYRFCLIEWASHNEASGVPSLNARTIESIEVDVASPEEQRAIAAALSEMDDEIALLELRLIKASQIKQGMMQELLTGRVRLL